MDCEWNIEEYHRGINNVAELKNAREVRMLSSVAISFLRYLLSLVWRITIDWTPRKMIFYGEKIIIQEVANESKKNINNDG